MAKAKNGSEGRVGGMIVELVVRTANKGRNMGRKYATFRIEDFTGTVRCIMWSDEYARFKDQVTAIGITHAFRDAELVTPFINRAFAGEMTMDAALASYTSVRAADYLDYFNLVCKLAEMNVYSKQEVEFFYSIHKDQARVDEIISQFGDTLPLSQGQAPPATAPAAADFVRAFEGRAEAYAANCFRDRRLPVTTDHS